jgi:hypothetical protein
MDTKSANFQIDICEKYFRREDPNPKIYKKIGAMVNMPAYFQIDTSEKFFLGNYYLWTPPKTFHAKFVRL